MAEARFPIIIEDKASGPSREASEAMLKLRDAITGAQSNIRNYNDTLRSLKGSSDQVKAAKEQLKAKINEEQAAVTKATLALQKEGVTLGELNAATKKATAAQAEAAKGAGAVAEGSKDVGNALKGIGLGSSVEKFGKLKEAFGGANASSAALAIGAAALAAVIAALAAAALGAAIALGTFIVSNANAQRSMLLTQEGLLGSSEAARNFADQIDDVARRVPTAKDELAKLGDELAAKGLKGDELVDAMNAIAQTASAQGQAAGDKLKSQLEASLGGGAKAAREAAEKQFGALNAKKLLDLNVQGARFKETLSGLTRDVNLEPFLKGMSEILSFFDQSTVSGQALHDLVTMIGDGLSSAVGESAPAVKSFMKQLLIYALEGAIVFVQLKNQIRDAFGPDTASGVDALNVVLAVAKFAIGAIAVSLAAAYAVWRVLESEVAAGVKVFESLVATVEGVKKALTSGWSDTGKSVVTGLASGITGSGGVITSAISGLADKAKEGFKSALGIKSPSTVFAEFGEQTAAGFEQGVSGPAGTSASGAAASMVAPPGGGGARGGGGPVEIHVHIEAGGGAGGDAAKQMTQPSVLAAITKAVEDAIASAGLAPAPGGA